MGVWLQSDLRLDQMELWIPEGSLGVLLNIQERGVWEEERLIHDEMV